MRLRTFAVVVGTLVVASSPGGRPLAAGGPTTDGGERIVARDSKVHQIFALGGSVVYRRAVEAGGRQWMRIVAGRRLRVRGLPAGAQPSSIGRDADGRVVLAVSRGLRRAPPQPRWWIYDVARDVARPLRIDVGRRCLASNVALWRSRMAYAKTCWTIRGENVFLRDGGLILQERRRLRSFSHGVSFAPGRIALRRRSLAVAANAFAEQQAVWRLVDNGRVCGKPLPTVDEEEQRIEPVVIGDRTLIWGTSILDIANDDPRLRQLRLMEVDYAGHCADRPQVRLLLERLPTDPVTAVAVDGRWLYYATEDRISRLRLPRRGSLAPPANDDLERASP